MEIIFNKRKKKILILMISGLIIFFFGGIWFIISPPTTKYFQSETFIRFVGICTIAFAIVNFIGGVILLKRKNAGIIINEKGFINNAVIPNHGLIEWTDITKIDIMKIYGKKMLIIHVRDNEKYLNRIKSKMIKHIDMQNIYICGTPIAIVSDILDCSFAELEKTIRKYYKKYGSEPIT